MANKALEIILGSNILKYRTRSGMTQAQLAEKVGVSSAFVSRVERGEKSVKIETLLSFARELNVSCDALLREDDGAQLDTIIKLLNDNPHLTPGIEKIVRLCTEEFAPKQSIHGIIEPKGEIRDETNARCVFK